MHSDYKCLIYDVAVQEVFRLLQNQTTTPFNISKLIFSKCHIISWDFLYLLFKSLRLGFHALSQVQTCTWLVFPSHPTCFDLTCIMEVTRLAFQLDIASKAKNGSLKLVTLVRTKHLVWLARFRLTPHAGTMRDCRLKAYQAGQLQLS